MADPPHAPWHLAGECILGWVRVPRPFRAMVPVGLHTLPGPGAIVAVRYHDSPVGPYLELSLAVPARLGLRPGLCVVFQVVSSADARLAYRRNWGLPAVVGALSWRVEGTDRILDCEDPGIEVRGAPVGPAFPAWVPVRSIQRRADGPVVLPRRFMGLTRLSRTTVAVDDGADAATPGLSALIGPHPGAVMAGMRIVAAPARHPAGIWSSLRAPLGAVEPAMAQRVTPGPAHDSLVRPTTVALRTGA